MHVLFVTQGAALMNFESISHLGAGQNPSRTIPLRGLYHKVN